MHARTSLKTDPLSRRERLRLSLWPENQTEFPEKPADENVPPKILVADATTASSSEELLSEEEQRCCDMATGTVFNSNNLGRIAMMPFKFETLFGEEFTKNLTVFTSFQFFDPKSLLDIQRKNIEALSEAGTLALEGLQAVAKCQTELLSQAAEDTSAVVKEIMSDGSHEQKMARQTDLAKKSYEKSVTNWRELTETVSKSGKEATAIINDRVTSSLTELKSTLDKTKTSSQKKAA